LKLLDFLLLNDCKLLYDELVKKYNGIMDNFPEYMSEYVDDLKLHITCLLVDLQHLDELEETYFSYMALKNRIFVQNNSVYRASPLDIEGFSLVKMELILCTTNILSKKVGCMLLNFVVNSYEFGKAYTYYNFDKYFSNMDYYTIIENYEKKFYPVFIKN